MSGIGGHSPSDFWGLESTGQKCVVCHEHNGAVEFEGACFVCAAARINQFEENGEMPPFEIKIVRSGDKFKWTVHYGGLSISGESGSYDGAAMAAKLRIMKEMGVKEL